jgi:spore coat protein U-like protein
MKRLMIFLILLLLCGARLGAQNCQLGSIQQVSFMTYSGATVQTTGSIGVTCTSGTAYNIELSAGYSGSATNREMYCSNCTPQTLGYQLFSNASYTVNWGNTTLTDVSATGTGSNQNFTVYAQIPALESFYAGSNGSNYTDLVTVTIVCNSCTSISGNNQGLNVHLQQTAAGCGISASDLNFGNYAGKVVNALSTLQVGCSSGTSYHVGLSAGTATGATVTTRQLQNGTALLSYALYSNTGRTTNWGNTAATNWVSGTGTGVVQQLTVYGQLPAGQYVTPGSYTDTITASVTY